MANFIFLDKDLYCIRINPTHSFLKLNKLSAGIRYILMVKKNISIIQMTNNPEPSENGFKTRTLRENLLLVKTVQLFNKVKTLNDINY